MLYSPLLPAGYRFHFSPSSTPSDPLYDTDAKSSQRHRLPLPVVVRPDRADPVPRKPADDRPHRSSCWNHALGGVPSPATRQT